MLIPDPALRLFAEAPQQVCDDGLSMWEILLYSMLGWVVAWALVHMYHYVRR